MTWGRALVDVHRAVLAAVFYVLYVLAFAAGHELGEMEANVREGQRIVRGYTGR